MKKKSRLTDSWKNVFTFSSSEKRGIYLLMILIFLLAGALWMYRYYPPAFPKQDFSAFEKETDVFLAAHAKHDSLNVIFQEEKKKLFQPIKDTSWKNEQQQNFDKEKVSISYFDFDPNNLPDDQWKQLGLNGGQIRVINNYQSKGGKFRKKEDLKKIHVMENEYARLEPYIKIKEQHVDTAKKSEKKIFAQSSNHVAVHIDIGIADTIEMQAVKGIGPSRARGIFKYRQLLGGYYSVQQIREVYGIDSVVYSEIVSQVFIKDTTNIRKLNINTATAEQLGTHPYIRKKLAELIVKYRNEHGAFSDLSAIKHIPLVNEDLFRKLAPYLKVE